MERATINADVFLRPLGRRARCLFWEMQSRCHIKYNVFPFPLHFPSSCAPSAASRPPSVMERGVAAPPLNFHADQRTLTLGLAVVCKLCEVQAVLFFSDCTRFSEAR